MEKDPDNMIGGVSKWTNHACLPLPHHSQLHQKLSQWSSSLLSRCYCSHQVFWCQADNKGKTLRYHIKRGGGGGVCADLWDPLPGSATAFHLSLQDLGNGTALIVWFKNN